VAESRKGKESSKASKAAEGAQAKDSKPGTGERRASHRVRDDQQSGHGSMSALSKLRMLERKRAPLRALRDDNV
jgi:hypothetical protein